MPKKTNEPDPEMLLPLPVTVFHILVALSDADRHGYAIMQDVAERTAGTSRGRRYGITTQSTR